MRTLIFMALLDRFAPHVSEELRRLHDEVQRLTKDNARLQQEVSIVTALRGRRQAHGG